MNPARYQILDWLIGSVTYTLPLILLVLLVTVFLRAIRHENSRLTILVSLGVFLIALIAAGSSETNTALQITVIVLMVFYSVLFIQKGKKWKVIRWQLVALGGTLVGLIIMVLAPGNAIRQSLLPVPPSSSSIFILSFHYSFAFIVNVFKTIPVPVFVLLLASILISLLISRYQVEDTKLILPISRILKFILIPSTAIVLIASICAPTIYAFSSYPEQRAQTLAIYVFLITIVLLGIQIGNLISIILFRLDTRIRRWIEPVSLAILLIIALYPLRATLKLLPEIEKTREFARARDQREVLIQQAMSANIREVSVPAINSQHGIQELTEDPGNWVNRCIAESYGLESIIAH